MEVKDIINPEQNGAEQYLEQYGDRLVCVRHRIDKTNHKRLTTVELIIDEQDDIRNAEQPPNALKPIRIGFSESALRETLKQAGAFWDYRSNVWLLPFHKICELGLESRVSGDVDRIRSRTIRK